MCWGMSFSTSLYFVPFILTQIDFSHFSSKHAPLTECMTEYATVATAAMSSAPHGQECPVPTHAMPYKQHTFNKRKN